jgi:uncharacterized protein YjbI with pentapeptide repeats
VLRNCKKVKAHEKAGLKERLRPLDECELSQDERARLDTRKIEWALTGNFEAALFNNLRFQDTVFLDFNIDTIKSETALSGLKFVNCVFRDQSCFNLDVTHNRSLALTSCSFIDCDNVTINANPKKVQNLVFQGSEVSLTDLKGQVFQHCDFRFSKLRGQVFGGWSGGEEGTGKYCCCSLDECDFRGADLFGASFSEDFTRTRREDCKLSSIKFFASNLGQANLPECFDNFTGNLGSVAESTKSLRVFHNLLMFLCFSALSSSVLFHKAVPILSIQKVFVPYDIWLAGCSSVVFCFQSYFFSNQNRLWRLITNLPIRFPDGLRLKNKIFPWVVTASVEDLTICLNPGILDVSLANLDRSAQAIDWWGICLSLFMGWLLPFATLYFLLGVAINQHLAVSSFDDFAVLITVATGVTSIYCYYQVLKKLDFTSDTDLSPQGFDTNRFKKRVVFFISRPLIYCAWLLV